METGYGETMRNHDSGKYFPVAMSYLSSSLMLPQRSVHTIASWLEAERGGRGACHEVTRCPLPSPPRPLCGRMRLTVTFGGLAGWKGLVRNLRELQT